MKMIERQEYNSLAELRADKAKVRRALGKATQALEADAVDLVLPSNNSFLNSDFSYMRYVGYGITAFKTFNVVRKLVGFARTRRWR